MRATLSDPDILVLRGGGGMRTVVGMLFILTGIAWIALPSVVDIQSMALAYALGVWVALGAILIGGIVAGGRWGRTFDRRNGRYTSWWGLIFPLRRKEQSLEGFESVRLEKHITESRSQDDAGTTHAHYRVDYPISLISAAPPEGNLWVARSKKYFRARKTAETIARFLALPLHDSSSGQTVVREPDTLDESFADRMTRLGENLQLPNPPTDCRIRCEIVNERAVILLPPLGFTGRHYCALAFAALVLVGVLVFGAFAFGDFADDTDSTAMIIAMSVGALVLLLGLGPIVGRVLYAARSRERISVSQEGLWMHRRFAVFFSRRKIPTEELEELDLFNADPGERLLGRWLGRGSIRARSDRAECEFGGSLKPPEREWLYETIRYMVVKGPTWS